LVAIVWKQRLYLFWLTFLEKAVQEDAQSNKTFEAIAKDTPAQTSRKSIEVQLNWGEYFQGEWRPQQSSGYYDPGFGMTMSLYHTESVMVYAAKRSASGADEGVYVYFQLAGELKVAGVNYHSEAWLDVASFEQRFSVVVAVPWGIEEIVVLAAEYFYIKKYQFGTISVPGVGNCDLYFDLEVVRHICIDQGRLPTRNEVVFVHVPAYSADYQYSNEYTAYKAFCLRNKNSPPEIVNGDVYPWNPYAETVRRKAARYDVSDPLRIYQQEILTKFGMPAPAAVANAYRWNLTFPDFARIDMADSPEQYAWAHQKPFFYQDSSNAFFVEPGKSNSLTQAVGWAPQPYYGEKYILKIAS
jgi:hypothetical protein